jgi:hypothetical protein
MRRFASLTKGKLGAAAAVAMAPEAVRPQPIRFMTYYWIRILY